MRLILSRRGKRYHDISKLVSDALLTEQGSCERKEAFQKFHHEIVCDYHVSHLCGEHMLTPADLEKILDMMIRFGMGWHRGYFVPVAAFTYADTFNFLMSRRHKLNDANYGEIKDYLYRFF